MQHTTMLNRDHTIFQYRLNWFDDAYTPHFTADSKSWRVYDGNPPAESDRVLLLDGNRVCLTDIRTGEYWVQTIPETYDFSEYRILGTSDDGRQLYWKESGYWDDPACWIGNAVYFVLDLYTGEIRQLRQPEKPQEYLNTVDTVFAGGRMLATANWNAKNHSYLSVYSWDICKDTLTEVIRHELAPAPEGSEGDEIYHWEQCLQGSLAYDRETMAVTCIVSKNGVEILTKLITADLQTGDVHLIPLAIETEAGKTAFECWQIDCQWNASRTQTAFVHNGNLYVVDLADNQIRNIPVPEPMVSLRYTPDEQYLLAVFQSGVVSKYRIGDASCCACVNLAEHCSSLYAIYEDTWRWEFPDDSTLLAVTNFGGFLMDISGDGVKMKAMIDQCVGYDLTGDRFVSVETDSYSGKPTTIGSFRRYTAEDLIQKAKAILNQ